MGFQQALALWLVVGVVAAGCRKEPANERPRITITSPAESSSITVPDTLLVTVEAHDDIGLHSVSATLLDEHDIPVVSGVAASASGTSAVITMALPITSEQLPSGPYKLLATVSDGSLNNKDVRNLHVTGAPLRVRAVFTVVEAPPGSIVLYKTDSTGATAPAATWNMDLGGAAVDATAQRLFVAGSTTGDLRALWPDGMGTAWGLPNLSSTGIPWFTAVDLCADGRLYVGQGDNTIHAYNPKNGIGGTVAALPALFRARQVVTNGDLLVSTERHFVTGEHRLGVYFRQSGAPLSSQPLSVDPVGLFPRDADHVLIFGNSNGVGRVLDRTLSGSGTWEAYTWAAPITAVERTGPSTWLVALSNGDLQRFTYGGMGSISIGTTPVLTTMAYDAVNGRVYCGTADGVLMINPVTGASSTAWSVGGTVRKVLPLLNR